MPKHGSDDVAFLLVDGYDLLGFATQFEDTIEAMTEDGMTLGDEWPEPEFVGLKRASFSQEGFYDDAAAGSNAVLAEQEGTSRLLCYSLGGNTIGAAFTGYAGAMQATFRRVLTRGELHKAHASYLGSGEVDEGIILHELSAETEDGDTEDAKVDNAASSDAGGVGYLQVTDLDLDGHDDLTVAISHSADDETYVELVAFTAVEESPAAERKVVAVGTVNRYLASEWAYGGEEGTSPSATFLVGFARG